MLKLLIADDERAIRETLAHIVDWNSHGVEVIGLCKNGIEAYEMMLDETPDIVLTDLRMPGISGLELIERAWRAELSTQFIILSGFGEFEYARQAMKYGVQHYLLKPCNEAQIIECIQACKESACNRNLYRQMHNDTFRSLRTMLNNVLFSVINDELAFDTDLDQLAGTYEQYLDFYFTPYRLCAIERLDKTQLEAYLIRLRAIIDRLLPRTVLYGCYAGETLSLFFANPGPDYPAFESELGILGHDSALAGAAMRTSLYPGLKALLADLTRQLKSFSNIYYISEGQPVYICNYAAVMKQLETAVSAFSKSGDATRITELLRRIDSADFLRQISSSLLLRLAATVPDLSAYTVTEWLMAVQKEPDPATVKESLTEKLGYLAAHRQTNASMSSVTRQVCDCIQQHLDDPDLTLKYIAENYLFMNVDYVSRKFCKETGEKFSRYLTRMRIRRAKELLAQGGTHCIEETAVAVGFGNNPRYFSQMFKKLEGKTPTEFIADQRAFPSRSLE